MSTVRLKLPSLHAGQTGVYLSAERFNAVRCGRRFGKDVLQNTIAADAALKGRMAGLFAPEYKQLTEPFDALWDILQPIKKRSSRAEGVIRTINGGGIDFWPLNDNALAGRGREYDVVCINEAGFTKAGQMWDTWERAILLTLAMRLGCAWVLGTPAGISEDNFMWQVCEDPIKAAIFRQHHMPSTGNPLLPLSEIERMRETMHPLVFEQEVLARFIDWSGVAFFAEDKWLVEGKPVDYPHRCDAVGCVIDTAIKDGKEHDATGVLYWAFSQFTGHRVVLLDYDKVKIQGAFLDQWLPGVYKRLDELALQCGSRGGALPPFIEDKGSGTILLQQCQRNGWRANALPGDLVEAGKDGRAISVSGYHHRGLCKISGHAYDKLVNVNGVTRNHLKSEVIGFRLGDPQAHKRADELLDDYCYTLAVTCGDGKGF